MKYNIYTGADGRRFVGEPGFGELVAEISMASGASVTRHVADAEAAGLLHQVGQHTQAEVIVLSEAHTPGYGPANPVNMSTHCRHNDGIAYTWWPRFALIPKWARGIDVNVALRDKFCAVARTKGFTVTVTYPGSVGEAQHVNFRKAPKINWWQLRPLHPGDGGMRARQVVKLLAYIHDPDTKHPYLGHGVKPQGKTPGHRKLDPMVTAAVKSFQKDHHQKPDGIVGVHTIRALRAAKRRAKQRRKEANKK